MRKKIDMNNPTAIKHRPHLYRATTDAEWSTENERWELTAKRIKRDGTLGDVVYEQVAIGKEEDDVPILEGDLCLQIITADGLRALQKIEATQINDSIDLFKVVAARAYYNEDESEEDPEYEAGDIVPVNEPFDPETMTLKPTWDWVRWPEPES